MPRLTITLSDELAEFIEEKSGDNAEFDSKSEAVRYYLDRGQDAEELEREVDVLENRLDDLRRQMYAQENVEEKVDVLATKVERTQQAADAPFFIRWGRWVSRKWQTTDDAQTTEKTA